MTFNPKLIFWITFAAFIGHGIGAGTAQLTNMIPADWIPSVMAWIAFLTFCALGFLTIATGYAGVGKGPLADPPTADEARKIQAQAVQASMAAKP